MFLLVVYGLPCSGKSTLCHALVPLVSADLYLELDALVEELASGETSYENWVDAHRAPFLLGRIRGYERVIADDVLPYKSNRKLFKHIAEELKLRYLEIYMNTAPEICLERLKGRNVTSRRVVSEETMARMMRIFEVPRQKRTIVTDGRDVDAVHQAIEEILKRPEPQKQELTERQMYQDKMEALSRHIFGDIVKACLPRKLSRKQQCDMTAIRLKWVKDQKGTFLADDELAEKCEQLRCQLQSCVF